MMFKKKETRVSKFIAKFKSPVAKKLPESYGQSASEFIIEKV